MESGSFFPSESKKHKRRATNAQVKLKPSLDKSTSAIAAGSTHDKLVMRGFPRNPSVRLTLHTLVPIPSRCIVLSLRPTIPKKEGLGHEENFFPAFQVGTTNSSKLASFRWPRTATTL